ncbi:MAG: AAA family ATPase [Mariprofundaceae bacterium]
MSIVSAVFETRVAILALIDQMETVLAGKRPVVENVVIALLANGHVLIEDIPGVGKTTLAQGLAAGLDTDFGRIQFTADMLPADIIGVQVFDPADRRFVFHNGPIFHHIVLADEINRATPKAQSALLQAMEERQVSVDQETHDLPDPFLVMATQNPTEHLGTFPLPESQLDRFFMRVNLGYPDAEAERRVLMGEAGRCQLEGLRPAASLRALLQAQRDVAAMPVSEALLNYLLELLQLSRSGELLRHGVSPRAGQDVLAAAKARAWLAGRDYVSAADLQAVWVPCLAHRVQAEGDPEAGLMLLLDQQSPPA